jgi:hypothetical protein
MNGPRRLDVDGRAVDEQRPRPGPVDDAVRSQIQAANLLARRQHGDDDVGAGDRGAEIGGRGRAGRHRPLDGVHGGIEGAYLVAGRQQIAGHRQAHVS